MANFWDDIGNWVGGLFNQQPTSQMCPQSEVQQAIQSGNAMATTPSYQPPSTAIVPSVAWGTSQSPSQINPWLPMTIPGTRTPVQDTPLHQIPGSDYWTNYERTKLAQETARRQAIQDEWERQQKSLDYTNQLSLLKQKFENEMALAQANKQDDTWYKQQLLTIQREENAQNQARWQAELAAQEKEQLAQLSAQPRSWLEYAALANQPPVVQPWMLPLMPQEYNMTPVGQQIPGWGQSNMQNMPSLINPSAQLWARMGPTAQQQYQGYQQAQQGATPEETQFRLWAMGPPEGKYSGLIQRR